MLSPRKANNKNMPPTACAKLVETSKVIGHVAANSAIAWGDAPKKKLKPSSKQALLTNNTTLCWVSLVTKIPNIILSGKMTRTAHINFQIISL